MAASNDSDEVMLVDELRRLARKLDFVKGYGHRDPIGGVIEPDTNAVWMTAHYMSRLNMEGIEQMLAQAFELVKSFLGEDLSLSALGLDAINKYDSPDASAVAAKLSAFVGKRNSPDISEFYIENITSLSEALRMAYHMPATTSELGSAGSRRENQGARGLFSDYFNQEEVRNEELDRIIRFAESCYMLMANIDLIYSFIHSFDRRIAADSGEDPYFLYKPKVIALLLSCYCALNGAGELAGILPSLEYYSMLSIYDYSRLEPLFSTELAACDHFTYELYQTNKDPDDYVFVSEVRQLLLQANKLLDGYELPSLLDLKKSTKRIWQDVKKRTKKSHRRSWSRGSDVGSEGPIVVGYEKLPVLVCMPSLPEPFSSISLDDILAALDDFYKRLEEYICRIQPLYDAFRAHHTDRDEHKVEYQLQCREVHADCFSPVKDTSTVSSRLVEEYMNEKGRGQYTLLPSHGS